MHVHDEIILNKDNPAVKYLCTKDKRLSKVIDTIGEISYQLYDDGYAFLIHEIIEQMLSIKAGAVIYSRLQGLCDNNICPEKIAGLTDKQIKSIGTANSKVSYIKGVTEAVLNGNLVLSDLQILSDDEVIKKLTSLRGICYGVELEPKFVDVAVKRYLEYKNGDVTDVYVIRDGEKLSYEDAVAGMEDADGTTE